jgi:hypothetical protein
MYMSPLTVKLDNFIEGRTGQLENLFKIAKRFNLESALHILLDDLAHGSGLDLTHTNLSTAED